MDAVIEEIKQIMKELAVQSKETDRRFQETEKRFQETEKMFKETDRRLDERFKETDEQIAKTASLFESQWGKLIESLVEGDLVRMLNQRGIEVRQTSQRQKGSRNGENFEFDIIAHNGHQIVIVEVKTTLRPDDVKDFVTKLEKAKIYMPHYASQEILGAVAYLQCVSACDVMAEKMGLFVIKATGNSASIENAEKFVPKVF